MVVSRFICNACGQHFETKSDLKDHEKNCKGQAGSKEEPGKQPETGEKRANVG